MEIIRPYRSGDEQGIARLFEAVFQKSLSLDEWRWKYRRGGVSPPAFIAEEDGEIVCHYGALQQRVFWRGEARWIWNIVDVMCHPRHQGRGIFRRTAKAFLEAICVGRGLLIFGFPGERHRKLGEIVLGYEPVAPVFRVRKVIAREPRSMGPEALPPPGLPADWDMRWRRLATRFEFICPRDREFLSWRYLSRPANRYRVVTLPDEAALAVVGLASDRTTLMEFLVEHPEPARASRLLSAAEAVAREQGNGDLEGWFARFAWETDFLVGAGGFEGVNADHYLECQLFEKALTARWLSENFYYSLGDYDVP